MSNFGATAAQFMLLGAYWFIARLLTVRADGRIPALIRTLPAGLYWRSLPALHPRKYVLWRLPLVGAVTGGLIVCVDLYLLMTEGCGLSLFQRIFALAWPLLLFLLAQAILLQLVAKWARQEHARRKALRSERQQTGISPPVPPAIPPAT
ncbi:MAG: hypothetical protein ACO25F_06910 [Erythrobacter sp.]